MRGGYNDGTRFVANLPIMPMCVAQFSLRAKCETGYRNHGLKQCCIAAIGYRGGSILAARPMRCLGSGAV
jgi:hypothetical protein